EQPRAESVLVALETGEALGHGDEDLRGQILRLGRGPGPEEGEDRGMELSVEPLERPRRSGARRSEHVWELLAESHGDGLSAQRLEHLARHGRVHLVDGILARRSEEHTSE